jgi:hypothetical protein
MGWRHYQHFVPFGQRGGQVQTLPYVNSRSVNQMSQPLKPLQQGSITTYLEGVNGEEETEDNRHEAIRDRLCWRLERLV